MMTGQQYKDSLKKVKPIIYFAGEKIEDVVTHPLTRPHVNSAAKTYDAAFDPTMEDLGSAVSHLTGKKINRWTHIHQSTDDLLKKVRLFRMVSQRTGTCYQRCVGFDALNATYATTYDMDQKNGTNYHKRFVEFLKYIQESDEMVAGAMTDPKGDRGLRPGQQADPDLFVHVAERNDKGVVIRGAKAHMTGMANSHWALIMPTTGLVPEDKDYAIVCAVPVDAPGIIHIFGRQTNDERKWDKMDQGNAEYGIVGGETLTVFNDVFVPWDKVFMDGETEFAGTLVERFACHHRQNYGACKGGVSDIIVGAAATIADYNGYPKAGHIKEKIVDMVALTEQIYACSIACSALGTKLASGAYYVDPLMANMVKLTVTKNIYEICRLAHDIAGGFIATLPGEKDIEHPELGKYVKKYFMGVASVPFEHRYRIARLIENMTGGTALVESMHGAGSPMAQRMVLARQANVEAKKAYAKKLAGIEE